MIRLVLALLNLLGFPGIGTLLAGHKKSGLIQLCLGVIGFALTVLPLYPILKVASPYLSDPVQLNAQLQNGTLITPARLLGLTLVSLGGMFLFFCNWLWSSTTTKPRTKTPPPLPIHTPH